MKGNETCLRIASLLHSFPPAPFPLSVDDPRVLFSREKIASPDIANKQLTLPSRMTFSKVINAMRLRSSRSLGSSDSFRRIYHGLFFIRMQMPINFHLMDANAFHSRLSLSLIRLFQTAICAPRGDCPLVCLTPRTSVYLSTRRATGRTIIKIPPICRRLRIYTVNKILC